MGPGFPLLSLDKNHNPKAWFPSNKNETPGAGCGAFASFRLNRRLPLSPRKFNTTISNINITMKRGSFAAHPRVGPNSLTTGTQDQSAGQNNTCCGKGDVFVIYDE